MCLLFAINCYFRNFYTFLLFRTQTEDDLFRVEKYMVHAHKVAVFLTLMYLLYGNTFLFELNTVGSLYADSQSS